MDFKALKKLETLSPSAFAAGEVDPAQRLLVIIRLKEGASVPTYVTPRARFGSEMLSAEITASDLARVEADPAVAAVSVSQSIPLVDKPGLK